jgi:hypothetical protein
MSSPAIGGSHKRVGYLSKNNPPVAVNSRVDYFLWLNDRMATIRLAKAIAIISDSKTVIQHHPLSAWGCADHP